MSSFLSKFEVFLHGTKYLHKNGKLYTIRDRESDDDYDVDEDWTFDAWCGPLADAAAQHMFDEFFIKQMLLPLRTPTGGWSYSQKAKTLADKLVKWLKQNPQHSQYEVVLRQLISYHPSMWKKLRVESIALLPPQGCSPNTCYDSEFIEYVEAYSANPHRSPTHEEITNILEYTLHHTSYPTRVFPVLNAAGFTPEYISPNKTLNGIPYIVLIRGYIIGTGATCSVECFQEVLNG